MNLYVIVEEKSLKRAHNAMKKFTGDKETKRFGPGAEALVGKDGKKAYRYTRWPMSEGFQARLEATLQKSKIKYTIRSILAEFTGFEEEKKTETKKDKKEV